MYINPLNIASIGLTEEQRQIQDIAFNFAREKMLPFAAEWDQNEKFPGKPFYLL